MDRRPRGSSPAFRAAAEKALEETELMRDERSPLFRSLLVPVAALSLASASFAIETTAGYSVRSSSSVSGSYTLASYYASSNVGVGAEKQFFEGGFGYRASVQATSSGLHAYNVASMENRNTIDNNVPVSEGLTSSSTAYVRFDDCIVTGTGTAPVRTRISALFEGALSTNTIFGGSPRPELAELGSYASATITLKANGQSILPDSLISLDHQFDYSKADAFGALSGFAGRKVVSSDVFTVIPNKPFSVQFGISTLASVAYNSVTAGSMRAGADFANTYSFATDRPVFELPAGYTMNSVSGHIVDNRFTPVPEPTSMAALGLGAAALLRRRKRT
jgi:hypothetical protein